MEGDLDLNNNLHPLAKDMLRSADKEARDWLDHARLYATECLPAPMSLTDAPPHWFDYVLFTYGQRVARRNLVPLSRVQLGGLSFLLRLRSTQEILLSEESTHGVSERDTVRQTAAKRAYARATLSWYSWPLWTDPKSAHSPAVSPVNDTTRFIKEANKMIVRLCSVLNADGMPTGGKADEPLKLNQFDLLLVQWALCAPWLVDLSVHNSGTDSKWRHASSADDGMLIALGHVVRVLGAVHGIDERFNLFGGSRDSRQDASLDVVRARFRAIWKHHVEPLMERNCHSEPLSLMRSSGTRQVARRWDLLPAFLRRALNAHAKTTLLSWLQHA